MVAIPDFITHYHRPDRPPFLNLSDLDGDALAAVLGGLEGADATRTSHRRFGPRYMELRRRTEEVLRARFVEVGGQPVRRAPHYFVLGESAWFRGLYDQAGEVRLGLAALQSEHISFTFPDSVTSMGLLPEYGVDVRRLPHHGQVFRLEALPDAAARYGLPESAEPGSYDGHQHDDFEHYVECQVWSDDAIATLTP